MDKSINILIVIPARGGSKGIPRKNIRALNGKPLIYYSIKTALKSVFKPTVVVSSDDEEILGIAKLFGAETLKRAKELAGDEITLDAVIFDAYLNAEILFNTKYDFVVTLQPTSPLLKTKTLDDAIQKLIDNPEKDSVISVKNDTHLCWRKDNNKFIPIYKERLNRQYLPKVYTETGSFFITNTKILTQKDRIGTNVDIYLLKSDEGIDIDSFADWNLCEYYLRRKKILIVVSGYNEIGMGHIYRVINIANDILNHEIIFLTEKKSNLGYEKIKSLNYNVLMQQNEDIKDDIVKISPDVIINDILDTSIEYMKGLKKICSKIINFEDCGDGSIYADIVINALYSEKNIYKEKYYYGDKYFIARDEFIFSETKQITSKIKNILITFGGTDPNNFTLKTLDAIYEYCKKENIIIDVILGLGYSSFDSLKKFKNITIKQNVKDITTYMNKADLIFSSAGRTVYEIAIIGTPSIILCQNQRETEHLFASEENGFINLGEGKNISTEKLFNTFIDIANNYAKRKILNKKLLVSDLKSGRKRTLKIINDFINE
ncbi:MAG: cytidyltransferase [Bacteroidales bacterium]|nr:cytidyltransferase [Bacteroidales bacterium]